MTSSVANDLRAILEVLNDFPGTLAIIGAVLLGLALVRRINIVRTSIRN